jgi:hypothetical protein
MARSVDALAVPRDGESSRAGELVGRLGVVHQSDRLRGRRECGIVTGDDGLRDEHGNPQARIGLENRRERAGRAGGAAAH